MNPHTPQFETLISEREITEAVVELATTLNEEYHSTTLTLVGVLKGAIPFLWDLMRKLECDVEVDFIQASSYGKRGTQRGELTLTSLGDLNVDGKDVLIIDDIFDSGATLEAIYRKLQKGNPRSLKSAVLLSKNVLRSTDFAPDYTLFEVDDHFVVGYGLDYKEKYRNLPMICKLGEGE